MTWIDVETLLLLFSMMLIVSIVSETGVFSYMGYWAFKVTKGKVSTDMNKNIVFQIAINPIRFFISTVELSKFTGLAIAYNSMLNNCRSFCIFGQCNNHFVNDSGCYPIV